jgi:predicted Zn finger-like uncharacterized protein
MHHDEMQIVCPNCSTVYEVPDEVFAGRMRRLRCEQCGHQWRAGPAENPAPAWPDATDGGAGMAEAPAPETPEPPHQPPAAPEINPAAPEPPPSQTEPSAEPPHGAPEPPPAGTVPDWRAAHVDYEYREVDEGGNDPFIHLVHAARSRQLETEPELPPPPLLRTTSPVFFGALVVAFVVAFLVMEFRPFGIGF